MEETQNVKDYKSLIIQYRDEQDEHQCKVIAKQLEGMIEKMSLGDMVQVIDISKEVLTGG